MICTFYSHQIGFKTILEIIKNTIPKAKIETKTENESTIAEITLKENLLKPAKKIRITYRERKEPSYQIPQISDSLLTDNLKGLYGYVSSLPTRNEAIKVFFLQKILTLNSEFSVEEIAGTINQLKSIIEEIANKFDTVIFTQPNTIISKSTSQHFLDKNLQLIIDTEGNCEIEKLDVSINSIYFDEEQNTVTDEQLERKNRNENTLTDYNIKINKNLPCIESEEETTIRSIKEIARRVSVLAVTNMVAFNTISSEEAIEYLKEYNLWEFVTPKEKDFLTDPTEEKKMYETWKCEAIYTLMWALKSFDTLAFPNELCDLNQIPYEQYPVGQDKDPNEFINNVIESRSVADLLDMADLYYRFDWACVDARINQQNIETIHPGIVYERHYALNWLINYMGQDWDNVSCDT